MATELDDMLGTEDEEESRPRPKPEDEEERPAPAVGAPTAQPLIPPPSMSSIPAPEMPTPGGEPLGPAQPVAPKAAVASPMDRYNALHAAGAPVSHKTGFGGGLLKGLDVAGNIIVPGVMANIPGTTMHQRFAEREALNTGKEQAGIADTESQAAQREALGQKALADAGTEAALKKAQTAHFQAQADELRDPNHKLPAEAQSYFKIPGNEKKTILDYEKDKSAAEAAGKPAEGEIPLGEKVGQFNQLLTAQYQTLNPGKQLPPEMALPANATQKDYDRRESVLKTMDSAAATQAQREIGNGYRAQAAELAKQAAQDRQDKQGMKWVSWKDKDGRVVAGSLSEAKKAGAENPAEVPQEEVRNITDARNAVNLINKKGDEKAPETMGVLQLAQSLDKDGKMGVFASRYNNFLTKGVGAEPGDDPRVVTLLDKGQLLMTLAMKAHFGASGGRSPQMLEHFISMANAGKMDGPTFMAGAKAVGNYLEDRAMMQKEQGGGGGGNVIHYDAQGNRIKTP